MLQSLPQHIAVIPDGNRRWAELWGLVPWKGHSEGRKRFREISEAAFALGIPYFTFWAASEDNLRKRSAVEISALIALLREELSSQSMIDKLFKNQIRFRVLGGWRTLIPDQNLADTINTLENQTRLFSKFNLTILLGYDGKKELVEAIQTNLHHWLSQPLDFETIRRALWTGELPPVDLVIRSGETKDCHAHLSSGFMMLHTADAELYFSKTLWPDFSEQELKNVLREYGERERKFGK